MTIKKVTIVFVLVLIGVIFGYDVMAIYKGGTEPSISHLLIVWSYDYPVFTFLFGFVMGHLFWRVRGTKELRKIEDRTRGGGK